LETSLNRSKTIKKLSIRKAKKSFFAKDDGDEGPECKSSEESLSLNESISEPNNLNSSFH
jgi:hypothetical protein